MPATFGRKLLLALAAPLVVFGTCELGLRAAGFDARAPEMRFPGFELVPDDLAGGLCPMQRHPTRFYQQVPNQRGPFASDEHAFRGGVHPKTHDNLLRVAFIGDSCTMGFGCRYGDSFVGVAAQRLRRAFPAVDVDAVNAGCAGYSTYQNRLDLEERVLPLRPDIVVICLSAWNDTQGALEVDDATWGERFAAAAEPSLGNLVRATRVGRWLEHRIVAPLTALRSDAMQGTMRELRRGDRPNGARVTPEQFRANVDAMIDRTRSRGVEVMIALLTTTTESAAADPEPQRYREFAREIAAGRSVPLLDAEPLFPQRDATLFFDPIHPTEAGHRAIGEALAERITERLRVRLRRDDARPRVATATIASLEPAAGFAFGDTDLVVTGRGFQHADSPRFLLGNEPLELLAIESDSRAILRAGALPIGTLDLELVTRDGTLVLPAAFLARGPELTVSVERQVARAQVRGRAGDSLTLFLATRRGDTPKMFGRRFLLAVGSLLPQRFEGVLDEKGEWSVAVPLAPATSERKPIFLQAIVEPRSGREPRIALYTEIAEFDP